MEFNFTVSTQKPELITKDEYPLFWWGEKNTALFDNIGLCKVQLEENKVICNATVTTGGIIHSINDITTAEFSPNDILAGKYEYAILFKNNSEGKEYVYGFCLT
jgi:hypothetical protein